LPPRRQQVRLRRCGPVATSSTLRSIG